MLTQGGRGVQLFQRNPSSGDRALPRPVFPGPPHGSWCCQRALAELLIPSSWTG